MDEITAHDSDDVAGGFLDPLGFFQDFIDLPRLEDPGAERSQMIFSHDPALQGIAFVLQETDRDDLLKMAIGFLLMLQEAEDMILQDLLLLGFGHDVHGWDEIGMDDQMEMEERCFRRTAWILARISSLAEIMESILPRIVER